MTTFIFTGDTLVKAAANAKQGIAFDGTNIYTSDGDSLNTYGQLYKYNASTGTLVDDVDESADTQEYMEDHCIVGSLLYSPCTNYNNTPKTNSIRIYNISDLSLDSTVDISSLIDNDFVASISYHEVDSTPYFWISPVNETKCYQLNFDLDTQVAVYDLPYADVERPAYSGTAWIGSYYLGNKHSGADSQTLDVMLFRNGSFRGVGRYPQLTGGNQGLDYWPATRELYVACRDDSESVRKTTVSCAETPFSGYSI